MTLVLDLGINLSAKPYGLFTRAIFLAIISLMTCAIEWIDLRIVCVELYVTILWCRIGRVNISLYDHWWSLARSL